MAKPITLAVMGAGLIGKRHIEHILDEPSAELIAVVDPSDVGRVLAAEHGVRWFASFAGMMQAEKPLHE
jgi:predicted dehydrogenase